MDEHDQDDAAWAAQQWGTTALGDPRRTRRAVRLGAQLAAQADAGLPDQTGTWDELRAAYRLLHTPAVTRDALQAPHTAATRAAATGPAPVLFVQDTTTLDYTTHAATRGLGPVGTGAQRGLQLHTLLALRPAADGPPELLGLAQQACWVRAGVGRGRAPAAGEGDCWAEAVAAVGAAPAGTTWVSVGDAASDVYGHLRQAAALGWGALVRSGKPHRAVCPDHGDGTGTGLGPWARTLPARATTTLALRGRDGQSARTAVLQVAWATGTLPAPQRGPARGGPAVAATVVRVWEAGARGKDALDWVLVTTLPVTTDDDARQVAPWYAARWIAEEYHKALKTGCAVERCQVRDAAALTTLLGLVALVAVRLLRLRTLARTAPDTPAQDVIEPALLAAVARVRRKDPATLTVRQFWRELAGLGGFLGRTGDGEPGWQTVWKGWQEAQLLAWGLRHAAPTCW